MNNSAIQRRLEVLANKMVEEPTERVIVVDYDRTFTDSEKKLFEKIWKSPPSDNNITLRELDAQIKLIVKADQILLQYALYHLRKTMLSVYGDPDSKIDEWFFNQHFFNFFKDLMDCLHRVRTWQDKDKEEFLRELEENGLQDKCYRFPREDPLNQLFPTKNQATEKSKLTKKESVNKDRDG
jgi:hypothetical protein